MTQHVKSLNGRGVNETETRGSEYVDGARDMVMGGWGEYKNDVLVTWHVVTLDQVYYNESWTHFLV